MTIREVAVTSVPSVQTLGRCRVDGARIAHARAVELVAVLALSGGRSPRDWLLSTLFEDDPAPSSLPTLALRARKLGIDVRYDRDSCMFSLAGPVDCDVVELLARVKEERVTEALALYHGPFLPRSHSPFAVEMRSSVEAHLVAAALRSDDAETMAAVDRCVKHPELSEALVRRSQDPAAVSLSRSWLTNLEAAL
jgi:hypothetical protein